MKLATNGRAKASSCEERETGKDVSVWARNAAGFTGRC